MLVGWGTDSLRGERTKGGPPCGRVAQGRVGWEGTDKKQSSVRGEWGRGELVRGGWSFLFFFFFFFMVARVVGSASGRVAGAGRPGASSSDYLS